MENFNIKDFENFIYSSENVLDNTEWDLIEWQPHFTKELWEKKSFYANSVFKTANKVWSEEGDNIHLLAHRSKSHLKHLILIQEADRVLVYVQKKVSELYNRIEKFMNEYRMTNVDIMPKNRWFLELYTVVARYQEWLNEEFSETLVTQSRQSAVNPLASYYLKKTALRNVGDVLDKLHTVNLVSKNIKVPHFKKAFGVGIAKGDDKIEWTGSVGALNYFVRKVSIHSENKKQKWVITLQCFSIKGKKLTTKQLSNNKSVSQKDKKALDAAIRLFQFTTT